MNEAGLCAHSVGENSPNGAIRSYKDGKRSLYLQSVRARKEHICMACGSRIAPGHVYYRHDPYSYAQTQRGEKHSAWCLDCIDTSENVSEHWPTKRKLVAAINVPKLYKPGNQSLVPVTARLYRVSREFLDSLCSDPMLLYQLSADGFEELICDRLFEMGFEPFRTGTANHKDGGIDVFFVPRLRQSFPFLGAAQIKHRSKPFRKVGSPDVRNFAGAVSQLPVSVGIVVTNTSFTADARWFAAKKQGLLRLRELEDVTRWISGSLAGEEEWREIPRALEICPGITVSLGG